MDWQDEDSLVLSCPACRTFAQVHPGDRDTVCWQCQAHLLIQWDGRQVKLVVGAPSAEHAPECPATSGQPPPLPWPGPAIQNRRSSAMPTVLLIVIAALLGLVARTVVRDFSGPGSGSALRTPDGRIELELPIDWHQSLLPRPACQISATEPLSMESICVISQEKRGFRDISNYSERAKTSILGRLPESEASGDEVAVVNGRRAVRYTITGNGRLGVKFGYLVTIIETETRFNQVIGYTLASRLPSSKPRLTAVAYGLREVKPGR
jgi:hypothetical protein